MHEHLMLPSCLPRTEAPRLESHSIWTATECNRHEHRDANRITRGERGHPAPT
jgi:hypothetical protein